jgi:phospholipase/carboxylesterase
LEAGKMNKGTLSLTHLTREPTKEAAAGSPPPLLLLLHGVGSNERDLMGLTSWLDGRFFVASARAPITLWHDAYGWFRFEFTPNGPVVVDPAEAMSSLQLILSFMDELVEVYGVDPNRMYLMGFSQGTIMGLSVALTRPDKVAGIVAMSGRFPDAIRPQIAPSEKLEALPILLQHGTEDPVLPIRYGRAARETLDSLLVRLEYHEYRMGHHVTQESLAHASAWLKTRLEE